MEPALDKMRDHLVTKNVALEIAEKLCDSVASKLEGKVVGTFTGQWMCVLNIYHMLQTMHCQCSVGSLVTLVVHVYQFRLYALCQEMLEPQSST